MLKVAQLVLVVMCLLSQREDFSERQILLLRRFHRRELLVFLRLVVWVVVVLLFAMLGGMAAHQLCYLRLEVLHKMALLVRLLRDNLQ